MKRTRPLMNVAQQSGTYLSAASVHTLVHTFPDIPPPRTFKLAHNKTRSRPRLRIHDALCILIYLWPQRTAHWETRSTTTPQNETPGPCCVSSHRIQAKSQYVPRYVLNSSRPKHILGYPPWGYVSGYVPDPRYTCQDTKMIPM